MIVVRLRQMELADGPVFLEFPKADDYYIETDRTVVVTGGGEVRGHVHPDRWDAVLIPEEA